MRALILEAVPEMTEEWKWKGTPVWSRHGIVCTGEAYTKVVKLTFAQGARIPDPSRLFNSSLEGNTRRAIDIHEGEKFEATFTEIGFSEEKTQQRALVQYILRGLYRHGRPGQPVDFSRMTIEHLASQATKTLDAEHVAMIGNLFYVDDDLNHELDSKQFAEKRKMLRAQDAIWVDPWILSRPNWTENEIETRLIRGSCH